MSRWCNSLAGMTSVSAFLSDPKTKGMHIYWSKDIGMPHNWPAYFPLRLQLGERIIEGKSDTYRIAWTVF